MLAIRLVHASEVMRYLFKFSLDSVDKNQRVDNIINAIASECNTSSLDVTLRAQQAKIVNQRDDTEPLGRWPEGEKQFRHVLQVASPLTILLLSFGY